MNTQLPNDLYLFGFANKGTRIDTTKLTDLRELIRKEFKATYRLCSTRTSYGLKHIAESLLGRYVANGEFIAAMLLEGFKCQRIGDSPNACFNLSERGMKELQSKSIHNSKY